MSQECRLPLASELYAISQNSSCSGPEECHWCGAPCQRNRPHDDLPPEIGRKRPVLAKRPGNQFICNGCYHWRMRRLTVNFLGGGLKDVQTPENWSWFVRGVEAHALRPGDSSDRDALYARLLDPPPQFFLALRDQVPVLLQHAEANRLDESFTASTPVKFTLDNRPLVYTVYELQHALEHGPAGTEPGVQALVRLFGLPPKLHANGIPPSETPEEPKRGRGRPPKVAEEKNPAIRRV